MYVVLTAGETFMQLVNCPVLHVYALAPFAQIFIELPEQIVPPVAVTVTMSIFTLALAVETHP
jgi:hypothetical protein